MKMIDAINTNPAVSTSGITAAQSKAARRKAFGEVVGNLFYGTLMKQMNESTIKGKYFHGGRGEEAFRSQLSLELARRMGQSPTDPLVNRMFEAVEKRLDPGTRGAAMPVGPDGFPVPIQKSFSVEPAAVKTFPTSEKREFPASVKKEFAA